MLVPHRIHETHILNQIVTVNEFRGGVILNINDGN